MIFAAVWHAVCDWRGARAAAQVWRGTCSTGKAPLRDLHPWLCIVRPCRVVCLHHDAGNCPDGSGANLAAFASYAAAQQQLSRAAQEQCALHTSFPVQLI